MKKILAGIVLLGLIFSITVAVPKNASAGEFNDPKSPIIMASDSIKASSTRSYSMKTYCYSIPSCTKGKTLVPQQLWIEKSGGYAGYIPIESYYLSKTDIVVFYYGAIKKSPYVPTKKLKAVDDFINEGAENEENF